MALDGYSRKYMACAAQQESKAVGVDGRWFLARIRGLTEQEHLDHSLVWAIEIFLTDHRLSRAHFSPDYYESHNTQETGGCGVRQGTRDHHKFRVRDSWQLQIVAKADQF